MSFQDVSFSGVELGESLWGEPFTLSAVAYTGTISDVRGQGRIVFTGIEEIADLIIEAHRSQFASAPRSAPRPLLVARGSNWRVIEVKSDELTYTLTCKLQA